jgi:hypothetical protein
MVEVYQRLAEAELLESRTTPTTSGENTLYKTMKGKST